MDAEQDRGGRPLDIGKAARRALRQVQRQAIDELARRAAAGSPSALKTLRELAAEAPVTHEQR